MALLDDLNQSKARYNKLLIDVGNMSKNILSATIYVKNGSNLSDYYNVDSSKLDNGEIKTTSDDLAQCENTITTEIIPAIRQKITDINNAIAAEEQRIEDARKRAAEEEAQKRAAEQRNNQNNG